jgi:hypothetical protein
VKRFFVSEAHGAELKNLTEYRQSGTPGDFPGASFWYFLREKVLLAPFPKGQGGRSGGGGGLRRIHDEKFRKGATAYFSIVFITFKYYHFRIITKQIRRMP